MSDSGHGSGDQRLGPLDEEPVRPDGPPRTGESGQFPSPQPPSPQPAGPQHPGPQHPGPQHPGPQHSGLQNPGPQLSASQPPQQQPGFGQLPAQLPAAQPPAAQGPAAQPSAGFPADPQGPARPWWGPPPGQQPHPNQPSAHQPSAHQPSAHQPSAHQPSANPASANQGQVNPWGDYPQHQGGDGRRAHPTQIFPAPAGVQQVQPRSAQAVAGAGAPQSGGYYTPRTKRSGPGLLLTVVVAALTALLVGTAAGLGSSLLGATVFAPTPPPGGPEVGSPPRQLSVKGVAAEMLPSTVMVRVRSAQGSGSGSGFVLDAEGRIMTNNHVIDMAASGGEMSVEFHDGTVVDAELVGRSPSYDIAVIQVDPQEVQLKPSTLGDSDALAVGEQVVVIGSPLGLYGTVTEGIVSALGRPVSVGDEENPSYLNAVQTDASINPGNSGGPLIDMQGRVVGVNSAILTVGAVEGQRSGSVGLGFAIPIREAEAVGKEIIETGNASVPTIGAVVKPADNGGGARIDSFADNSAAQASGLAEGDVITAVDDRPVADHVELIVAIRSHRPGDEVTLHYKRNGVPAEAKVTLGKQEG